MQSKGVRREALCGNEDVCMLVRSRLLYLWCVELSFNRLCVAMKLYSPP